jgi:hypothetical protein
MIHRHEVFSPKSTIVGVALLFFAGCSNSSGGNTAGAQAGQSSTGGVSAGGSNGSGGTQAGTTAVGGASNSGGQPNGTGGHVGGASGSQTGGTTSGGQGGNATGGQAGGSSVGGSSAQAGGSSGQAGSSGISSQGGSPGIDGGLASACVGKQWPTADPSSAGPFEVAAEKKVGPLAGYTPDPIYGDEQQRFNIYRPKNLADSGYCHPILVWANGHTDNPEQNPPKCVVDSAANKWCGQYLPLMNHLASHGFVVIASLSTTTSKGDPLPTKVGLDWLLQQAEDPTSAYYHRLDTAHIGQLGHSEGGMSTCMSAKEPRYSAIATVSGTSTITGIHTPALFFCGGKENGMCDNNQKVLDTITTQPGMLINNLNADHGSWVYEGAKGVDLSGLAAWFRLHLMGDTAQRKRFYGDGCTFCSDSRVKVSRNSLMTP